MVEDLYRLQHPSTFIGGSSFLKDFIKLMSKSVFWKDIREFEETCTGRAITNVGILRKRVAKPNFCRGNPITDCLTVIQCTVATLNTE